MIYNFDGNEAKKYGVNAAIILSNFKWWILKNKLNGHNYYDCRTWTYNSMKSLAAMYPFMSENQIRYALKTLVEKGVLIKGNYNTSSYDRTTWYAMVDARSLENSQIHLGKLPNGNVNSNEPIPYNDTDRKTDNKPPISPKGENKFAEFYKKYPVKKGKKLAKDRWDRKKLDNKFDLIIKDVESRLNNDKQWLAGYIPHASTYIGREVWLDEIDTGKQNIDWESL